MGLDPVFVDLHCERPDQAQGAFLVGEDANDMGAALEFLANAFEYIKRDARSSAATRPKISEYAYPLDSGSWRLEVKRGDQPFPRP